MPNVDNTTTYWAEFQKAIAAVKDHPVRFVSLLPSFFPSSFLVSFRLLSFFPSFAQGRSCATCFLFPCSFLLSFVQDRNCATLLCTSAHSRVPIHSHVITRCALNILRAAAWTMCDHLGTILYQATLGYYICDVSQVHKQAVDQSVACD